MALIDLWPGRSRQEIHDVIVRNLNPEAGRWRVVNRKTYQFDKKYRRSLGKKAARLLAAYRALSVKAGYPKTAWQYAHTAVAMLHDDVCNRVRRALCLRYPDFVEINRALLHEVPAFPYVTGPGPGRYWPHGAYVCEAAPEKVYYYRSYRAVLDHEKTITTPGRYLTRVDKMSPHDAKVMAEGHLRRYGTSELFVSTKEEDFIRVIGEGPHTCMSNEAMDYSGHIHPAAVYATGDVAVCWLERNGTVTARTLANVATKQCTRLYGDKARLERALEKAGYTPSAYALEGCRLRVIPNENGDGYIMPYVDAGLESGDGCLFVDQDAGYWWLTVGCGVATHEAYDGDGVMKWCEPPPPVTGVSDIFAEEVSC